MVVIITEISCVIKLGTSSRNIIVSKDFVTCNLNIKLVNKQCKCISVRINEHLTEYCCKKIILKKISSVILYFL